MKQQQSEQEARGPYQHKSRNTWIIVAVVGLVLLSGYFVLSLGNSSLENSNQTKSKPSSQQTHEALDQAVIHNVEDESELLAQDKLSTSNTMTKEKFGELMKEALETEGASLLEKDYAWSRCIPSSMFQSLSQRRSLAAYANVYLKGLKDSPLYEERLAHALFIDLEITLLEPEEEPQGEPGIEFDTFDSNPKLTRLLDFYHNERPHSAVNNKIIVNCAQNNDERCTEELIDEVSQASRNNGQTWLNAAGYYASKSNNKKALQAAAEFSKTNHFDEHYFSLIKLYTNVMDGVVYDDVEYNFAVNKIIASGLVAKDQGAVGNILVWCKSNGDNNQIANACAEIGKGMINRSKSLLHSRIGERILLNYYELIGDTNGFNELNAKRSNLVNSKQTFSDMSMLMFDEKLGRQFLERSSQEGELAALIGLPDQVEKFYEQDNNALCGSMYKMLKELDETL